MAGHSKWKQIKHQKAVADKTRSKIFAKLANAISIAAKKEPNPDFNPNLRSIIDRAKKESMPQENIERAIGLAMETENLEEMLIEIYGPEGAGILVEAISDSKNRTINEIKAILKDYDAKLAPPGGLLWSFDKTDAGYEPRFQQNISEDAKKTISSLIESLESREDIKEIYLNIQ